MKFLCKLPVSLIMCRNCHDRTGTIAHQYIIRYPDRNFFSVDRIDCSQTVNCHTSLVFCKLRPLKIRLSGSLLAVCNDFLPVFNLILVLIQIWMLW